MKDENLHAVVARSTFRSQNFQKLRGSEHFWTFRCRFAWQAQRIVHLVKSEQKREGCVAFPKTVASVGHLKRTWKDAFSVPCAVQETCSSEMLGSQSGGWFPERGCILEHQICRFDETILRHRCSTSYDLASIFRGRRNTLDQCKNRKTQWYEAVSPFLKQVSLNCFFFDVVNWKKLRKSGRIASFLTLSSSKKLRKSRWIAALLMLSSSAIEDVSQNSFLFNLADRQIDG